MQKYFYQNHYFYKEKHHVKLKQVDG